MRAASARCNALRLLHAAAVTSCGAANTARRAVLKEEAVAASLLHGDLRLFGVAGSDGSGGVRDGVQPDHEREVRLGSAEEKEDAENSETLSLSLSLSPLSLSSLS